MSADCAFCGIIERGEYDLGLSVPGSVAVFPPLRGHSALGHLLVVPWRHIADAAEDPAMAGSVAEHAASIIAARIADGTWQAANLLTSIGAGASQSIFHLHWHIVPRGDGDNLNACWPWIY